MTRLSWYDLKKLKLKPNGEAIVKSKTGLKPGSSKNPKSIANIYAGNNNRLYVEQPIEPLNRGPYDRSLEALLKLNGIEGDPAAAIFKGPAETDESYSQRIIGPMLHDSDIDHQLANQAARGLLMKGMLTKTGGRNEENYRDAIQRGAFMYSHGQGLHELVEKYGPNFQRDVEKFLSQAKTQNSAVDKIRSLLWKGFLATLAVGAIYIGANYFFKSTPVYASSNIPENSVSSSHIISDASSGNERAQYESYLQAQFGRYVRFEGEEKGYVVEYNGTLGIVLDSQIQDYESAAGYHFTGQTINAFGYQFPVLASVNAADETAQSQQPAVYASSAGAVSGNSGGNPGSGSPKGDGSTDWGPFGLFTMGGVGVAGAVFFGTAAMKKHQ